MADLKISQLTNYTPAIDADVLPIVDSTANETKKIAWSAIKSTLKTYFDGLYLALNPTTIELGHASDTTLSRSAAGAVAIENVECGFVCDYSARQIGRSDDTQWFVFPWEDWWRR